MPRKAKPLVLKRIAYFDGNGKQVDSYLKQPIALKPFGTVDIYIPEQDVRGGLGANSWSIGRRPARSPSRSSKR